MLTGYIAFLLPGPVRALSFGLSYVFQDGAKVLGQVEADWGGHYLQNVSAASWTYFLADGTASATASIDQTFLAAFGPQLIPVNGSTDGLRLNFEQDTNGTFDFNFCIEDGLVRVGAPSSDWETQYHNAEATSGRWDLQRPSGVPEGGPPVLLLGMAVGVMMAVHHVIRRRGTGPGG